MDICKNLVDAELIYKWSSLADCDILHLFRYYWSNMSLVQVFHPHVILFMLSIGYIYNEIYFQSDVYPINFSPSTVIAPKKLLQNLVISYHCVALVLIFEVYFFVFYHITINFDKKWIFYIGGMYYMRVIFNPGM